MTARKKRERPLSNRKFARLFGGTIAGEALNAGELPRPMYAGPGFGIVGPFNNPRLHIAGH
jgi:hypothetical protein